MDGAGDTGATASADKAASRRRLSGFVSSEGYRPDLLSRIARISIDLQESAQAGRYWLLSDATGPAVDAAVDAFVESCQATPRLIASELPRFKRDWDLDAYAPAAKARIERFGLEDELAKRRPGGARRASRLLSALRRIFGRGGARLTVVAALAGPVAPTMNYDQAVAAFRTIKKGTQRAQVIATLGEPTRREKRQSVWDFSKLKGFPGIGVGRQTFTAGVITFDAAERVERAEFAWVDATGPAPRRR